MTTESAPRTSHRMFGGAASTRRDAALLVAVLLGILVRLAAISFLDTGERYRLDETGYLELDGQRGDHREYEGRGWHLVSGGNFWSLPNGDGNAPPGYAFFIGLIYLFTGREPVALLYMNAVVGGLTVALTYVLGRRVFGQQIGLLAAVCVAIDPLLVYWSTQILAETLTVALTVALLIAGVRVGDRPGRWREVAICGMLIAAAVLVRNQLVAVACAIGLWLLATGWRSRQQLWDLTMVTALAAVLTLGLTLVGMAGRPPGTVNQVEQMMDGTWLSARSYVDLRLEREAYDRGGRLTAVQQQQVAEAAERHLRETPAWRVLVWNWVERMRVFWRMSPGRGGKLEHAVYLGATTLLFVASLAGLITVMASRRRMPGDRAVINGLLVLTCVVVMFLHVLLIAKPRYRLPLHPILWMWASAFAVIVAERVRPFRLLSLSRQ